MWSNDELMILSFSFFKQTLWNTSASQLFAEDNAQKEGTGSPFIGSPAHCFSELDIPAPAGQGWTICRPPRGPTALGPVSEMPFLPYPVSVVLELETLSPAEQRLAHPFSLLFPFLSFFFPLRKTFPLAKQ